MDEYGREKGFREFFSRDFKPQEKVENYLPTINLNYRPASTDE
jgi:hypothetical protein